MIAQPRPIAEPSPWWWFPAHLQLRCAVCGLFLGGDREVGGFGGGSHFCRRCADATDRERVA